MHYTNERRQIQEAAYCMVSLHDNVEKTKLESLKKLVVNRGWKWRDELTIKGHKKF